ncbi:MAG: hypothetical protein HGA82_01285, partial [Anaerolineales bacterium]|nr:hypothetical protein [Anaerolineales bacterium]
MEYFLGVDIGGSKTHAALADSSGKVLGFGESGSGNHESVGYEGMVKVMREASQIALRKAGFEINQVRAGGFGIAGYDWPSERELMLASVRRLGIPGPVAIANDTMVGLLAGARQGWGVVVDAGTGDNCMGRDQRGREAHMTGCGPLFAEYGGSGSLVVRAIQAISLEWGHRGPATRLTQAFIKYLGAKDVDDLDPLYLPDGSIVFSSTREPKYCMCNRHIMANLFRMDADGANIHQIGKSTLFEGHGTLMPDGRILYDRWEYVDRNFGDAQGLWTVNPDGTSHAPIEGV